ncbi:MAG: hypothetical protein CSA40_01330 [Flavobacteriales bacterium]|nr:MAG: hypothetical protein CSA40_01330 [Flavobacteriales bacterium]
MSDFKTLDSRLIESFLEYYGKSIKAASEHPNYELNQSNFHRLSKEEKEARRVFSYMNKVYGLISDLEKTHTFIRRFPIKEYYNKNNINQLDFIKYHYEVFIHKVHTLLEVKKLWLNDFYEIGLKEKDCNWNNLKGYQKIQKSPTKIIVESYFNSFEHIIEFRHLNTHRALFIDPKNENLNSYLSVYEGLKKYGIEPGDDLKRTIPKFVVEYSIKEYRKEKLEHVKKGIKVAKLYSERFITIILKEFFKKNNIKP